jgi:hypothetical protein
MIISPHDLRLTKIKKVISRHLLSAADDTHRIGLQENEVGTGSVMAQGMERVVSVVF